jgi:hypothetical protein
MVMQQAEERIQQFLSNCPLKKSLDRDIEKIFLCILLYPLLFFPPFLLPVIEVADDGSLPSCSQPLSARPDSSRITGRKRIRPIRPSSALSSSVAAPVLERSLSVSSPLPAAPWAFRPQRLKTEGGEGGTLPRRQGFEATLVGLSKVLVTGGVGADGFFDNSIHVGERERERGRVFFLEERERERERED